MFCRVMSRAGMEEVEVEETISLAARGSKKGVIWVPRETW